MLYKNEVKTILVILLNIIISKCEESRRILNGNPPSSDKPFVVYFSKTSKSITKYDAWICGGSIVHPSFIVTSAACLEDVYHLYAIAGYNKYVNNKDISTNPCTSKLKKKIIMTCIPKRYHFSYEHTKKWGTNDIAIAKTESPYNFNDAIYKTHCSYIPQKIDINYDGKYQFPGVDAVVLGWGHTDKYRKEDDPKDYNNAVLLESPVLLVQKKICKKPYPKEWSHVIDKYMICSSGAGNIDGSGKTIGKSEKIRACSPKDNPNCPSLRTSNETQRNGFCQNDHGGPLITWVGSKLKLLGVQSIFTIMKDLRCSAPFLYTSTYCNSVFLDCIINDGRRFNSNCDENHETNGFTIEKRSISWKNHTDGPADNEKEAIVTRRRPMKDIRGR